ncbi:MAG: rod shape-determining protein MreC, partial [Candidatus Binatia bacterium]
KMKYLSLNADIFPGDQVISSGLGGLYPKGLPIGRVMEVERKGQGFFKEAQIRLNVDMNKLEEVLVVTRKE